MVPYYLLDPVHPDPLPFERTVLALGMFDGVHVGHREILKKARQVAIASGSRAVPVAVTLDRHPASALGVRRVPPLITDLRTKVELIRNAGVEAVVVMKFDRDTARIEPREFILRIIKGQLRAACVVVGFNYTFGRGARGTPATLCSLGSELGFEVVIVPPVFVGGALVRSSAIRALILRGRVDEAARLLGRPFSVSGSVVRGDGRGRNLGFPTANLSLTSETLLPALGVYAVRVVLSGLDRRTVPGVMNLGTRPTFSRSRGALTGGSGNCSPEAGGGPKRAARPVPGPPAPPVAEVHLIDYDGDLYGQTVTVQLVKRLRGEVRFSDSAALARQIGRDVGEARAVLQGAGFVIQ